MILIQKIIRGLTIRIEEQFKSMNELYRYSTQDNPCFSNTIFAGLPSLGNSSNIISDILMASMMNKNMNNDSAEDSKLGTNKLVFEHFLDYTINCINPIYYDFYSNDNLDSFSLENKPGQKQEKVSFFELIRLNFYSSILSILTTSNNIGYLTFSPLMYSTFLQKFPDFFTNNIALALDINEYGKNNYLYLHCYSSIQNIFNSLSRFKIDIFKSYIHENDSKGRGINLSKICDAAILLVQNEQSLQSFTKDLTMMLGISTTNIEKSEFLTKLFQFFINLFIKNPELYQIVIKSDGIIENLHQFFILLIDSIHIDSNLQELSFSDTLNNDISRILPILSVILPFLYKNVNFDKYQKLVIVNLTILSSRIKNFSSINSKEMIFDYLNSFIALLQSTLLISNSKTLIPSIVEFVQLVKPDFDTFLFKYEGNSQSPTKDDNNSIGMNSPNLNLTSSNPYLETIKSTMFLFNILPNYLALDIAKASKDYDEDSSDLYSITPSVSFCTQSSNIYCSISLIQGLSLLMNGYPFKNINPITVQIILNIIFNIVDMYKNPTTSIPTSSTASQASSLPSSSSSQIASNSPLMSATNQERSNSNSSINDNSYSIETVDNLHRNAYELISGHSYFSSGDYSNEYELIPTFLDLIASENSTSLAFFHFIINEVRSNFVSETKQTSNLQINVTDFSADTIASFFVLLNAVFSKPSRWTIFTSESTNTSRFFKLMNTGFYKLYKDILRKNISALFCFNTVMVNYLSFSKEIIKISKNKIDIDEFIDSVERIILLMNSTSDEINSELLNKELRKFSDELGVPFYYEWPLKFNSNKTALPSTTLNEPCQISPQKLKTIKEKVIFPIMKFCYLFWFDSAFHYLCQNNFINYTPNNDKNHFFARYQIKSTISLQLITRITSFLCRYSCYIDEIQPLLAKHPAFKLAKIKFSNAFLDFVSHDIKDDMTTLISSSIPLLDSYTSNLVLKIIRSNLMSTAASFSFTSSIVSIIPNGAAKLKLDSTPNENITTTNLILHPNCYLVISELINEDCVFYNDQSYKMCEEIILNLITVICMDQKFKLNPNDEYLSISIKTILYSISNIIYKFYSFSRKDVKSSSVARMSIISTILNYMISTQNSIFSVIIAKPLPQLFKDFVITSDNELSGSISDYDNLIFIRKTIDKLFSFFFLILSSNDKSALFTVCQESIENILLSNYKEGIDIFVTSLLNYSKSDFFSTVMLKSFSNIAKKSPEIIKNYFACLTPSNPTYSRLNKTISKLNTFRNDINNSSFTSIIKSNINSIHFYEAVIDVCSYQNKLCQLFIAMCNKYTKIDNIDDSNFYEKINSPFFFISFFKNAATQSFINSFSVFLFKMSIEKTIENLHPPIQFVFYWQLFSKLTNEDPLVVLDKFFIRPILLQPHLYKLDPSIVSHGTTSAIIQCNAFIKKLQQNSKLKIYLDHLMKDQIPYFEVCPKSAAQIINSQSILFHFLADIPFPGNFITFSNVSFDNNSFDVPDLNRFALARIVFEFIESQCLVCIDKDRNRNKNWLLSLDKLPENSIPLINECFRVLIMKTIEEKEKKNNVFSTFYEESNSTSNKFAQSYSSELSSSSSATSSTTANKSNENSSESNSKSSKRIFAIPFFKMKPHSKKNKEEDKNKSKENEKNSSSVTNEDNRFQSQNIYLSQINLYINMQVLPSNYLSILEIIFAQNVNSINLIFTPIGVLNEIETNIINKQPNNSFSNVKVISNPDDNDNIILPFHISTTKINCNCLVNNNPGSIGFFQEFIIISSLESFRGQQYQVSTISTYTIFRLPKAISKTEIEISFQPDQNSQSSIITTFLGKKINSIILNFDLNSDNENQAFVRVSPDFIIEAIQSSTGSTIGDKKIMSLPLSINSDPTIALIATSLFYIPNNDSTVSETALELFWQIIKLLNDQSNGEIKNEPKNKEIDFDNFYSTTSTLINSSKPSILVSNSLSLPLDGFIRVLQGINYINGYKESTLFSSVVQFVSSFMPIVKQENVPMLSFLSLISAFISFSNDQSALSGICYNLLVHFNNQQLNDSNDLNKKANEITANDQFQLLQIWSTVRNQSFTSIALPQIIVFVQNSVNQSQLIHCLSAKNRKTVNEVLIENLLYKDLTSFRLYNSICSNGLFKIFPSIQFLGRPEIILFLNLVVALTASNEIALPFINSLKSFFLNYQKNKQLITQQSNEFIDESSDDMNDDENSNLYSYQEWFNNSINGNDSVTSLFIPERFDPEKSNIYSSAKKIVNFFDKMLQDSVNSLFELMTKKENSNVWHLRPNLSTSELLEAMTDSIVPDLNLKKLNFCLATFQLHQNDIFSLFWVALPYLLSEHQYVRRLAIDYITFLFDHCRQKNEKIEILQKEGQKIDLIDPFNEILKVLNCAKNLQYSVRAFGELIGVNFEENLPIAFASILIGIILRDDKMKPFVFKLILMICKLYKTQPSKTLEFVMILIVYTNKITANFIKRFPSISVDSQQINSNLIAISSFIKETVSTRSKHDVLWVLNFLVWLFSQQFNDGKYQIFTMIICEILKSRMDITRIVKDDIIARFLKFTDNKDAKIQEYLAYIFAVANSASNEVEKDDQLGTGNNQKISNIDILKRFLWVPKPHILVEQHLYSFCVNFHASIQSIVKSKV